MLKLLISFIFKILKYLMKFVLLEMLCTPGGFEPILRKCPQIDKLILFVKKEHHFVFSKTQGTSN